MLAEASIRMNTASASAVNFQSGRLSVEGAGAAFRQLLSRFAAGAEDRLFDRVRLIGGVGSSR